MKHKLRTLDAQVLTELSQTRSTLHSIQSLVPSDLGQQVELNIRAIDRLLPKLKERKRV